MAIIAMQSASSGLRALNTRLDVIANNLANVNTEGFKASRVNFEDLMYVERAQPGIENSHGDQRPTGLYVGLGVRAAGTQQDFSLGAPVPGRSSTRRSSPGDSCHEAHPGAIRAKASAALGWHEEENGR